jgi:putative nucleotidyltransferase with HDIG domain
MPHTQIEYVGAGSFSINSRSDLILRALLGTCVGVALFDHTAQIGGIIHLLLPEPIGPGNPWQPESYASTGLPLFIEQLCKAGAQKERLEAFIAGGALIGSVSEQDLDLDIGGRTSDVVADLLARETIQIRESETGGVHGMLLSLDLDAWKCTIEPMVHPPSGADTAMGKPTAEEIGRAIARVRPVPQVSLKIIRMIVDNRYNLQDVATEVRQDQIITAKVLKLCNSAMIGRETHIDSVDEALMILGEKMLLLMIMSSSMQLCFPESELGYSMGKGRLYHHAIGTALVAEKLARTTGRCNPVVAYTAGLLHDIGKVVLDHFVARNYPLFYRRTENDMINLEDAEVEILGIGHPEVGGRLARLWSIPENLVEAIRYHHQPEKATHDSELTHVVCLADLIISRFWTSQALGRQNTDALTSCLKKLGLNSQHLRAVVDSVPWNVLNSLRPLSP